MTTSGVGIPVAEQVVSSGWFTGTSTSSKPAFIAGGTIKNCNRKTFKKLQNLCLHTAGSPIRSLTLYRPMFPSYRNQSVD